jgi:N4-gp56 family major capsid protein
MAAGAITTTTDPGSVANRIQVHFSKRLLEVQVDTTIMDQFGIQEDLPKQANAKSMRFFKPAKAGTNIKALASSTTSAHSYITALTEGTPPTTYRQNDWTYVDATLKQWGQVTKISDILTAIDMFKPLKQNIDLMGRDSSLFLDTVIRNGLIGSSHPDGVSTVLTYDSGATAAKYGCEAFVTGSGTGALTFTNASNGSAATFATLLALVPASNAVLKRLSVLSACTRLKTKSAPRLKGNRYVACIAPQVFQDLLQDTSYANAFQGRGSDGIYKGEQLDIDGVKFVETTNPYIEDDVYATYDDSDSGTAGLIYSTIFLGAGAYGCPKLAGSTSPLKPQVVISTGPEKSDPLDQFSLAGWKAYFTGIGLDSDNICVVRSKAVFAA